MMGIHVTMVSLYTCLIGVILQVFILFFVIVDNFEFEFQAIIVILAFQLSYLILTNKKSMDHQEI